MIKLCKGLYIHYTTFLIFLLSFIFKTAEITSMAFLTAFCHELCHLFTALCLGEKCKGIAIMPYGCRLFMAKSKYPIKEFIIALSGPLFNIVLAFLLKKGPLFEINIAMAMINLFPVAPLDGGRMAEFILGKALGPFRALFVMKKISLIGALFLTTLGIVQALTEGFNLSVFTAGAFLLFSAIMGEGKERLYLTVMTDKEKLLKGAKKGMLIAARESLPARKILPLIPPGNYAFIKVIDKFGRVKGEITEEELTEKIEELGAGVRLREIS